MRLQSKQFLTLSGLTALEAARQPISLLITACCVLLISFLPLLISHKLGDGAKLIRDSSLSLYLICGLLLGGFISCSSLSREIKRGTAAAVLSKPINRTFFFISKYCGVAAVMLLFSGTALLATICATRAIAENYHVDWWAIGPLLAAVPLAFVLAGVCNYFSHRPFASNAFGFLLGTVASAFLVTCFVDPAGRVAAFGSAMPWEILPAGLLLAAAVLVLSAMTVTLATRFSALTVITVVGFLLTIGLMSDYFFGHAADTSTWAAVLYALIPNWQIFWVADAITVGDGVSWWYVLRASVYALLYLSGILCIGVLLFERIEIKA